MKTRAVRACVLGACLGAAAFLQGCSLAEEAQIGNDVETPLALVGIPSGKGFYVLNSSSMGSYPTGSLLKVDFDAQGNMVKGKAITIPRLAMDAAISPDGKEVAIAFSGGEAGIRFADTSDPDAPVLTQVRIPLPPDTLVSQLRYFDVAGQRVLVAQMTTRRNNTAENRAADARVAIWKPTGQGYARAALLPDDVPGLVPPGINVGFGSPFYLENEQLLGMLPQGWEGRDRLRELLPDCEAKNLALPAAERVACPAQRILDFLKDPRGKPVPDYIATSALAFDLGAWLGGTPLDQSYAVLPLFYNSALQAPDPALPANDPRHTSLSLRPVFGPSQGISGTGCAASAAYAMDSTVGEKLGSEEYVLYREILRLRDWDQVKAAIGTELQASTPENRFASRVLTGKLQLDAHSRTTGVTGINRTPSSLSGFVRFDGGATGGPSCAPAWLRIEENRAPRGYEVTRLSLNEGRPPESPLLAEIPTRGGYAMTVVGERIVVASYSRDELFAYAVEGDKFNLLSRLQ